MSAQSNAQRLNVALAYGLADWLEGVRDGGEQILRSSGKNYTEATMLGLYAYAETTLDGAYGEVGSRSPHAIVVHEGRGANKPPPPWRAISRWVEKKLGVDPKLNFVVTRAIRAKIAEFGTKGLPFLQEPYDRLVPDLVPTLAASVDRAFEGAAIFEAVGPGAHA